MVYMVYGNHGDNKVHIYLKHIKIKRPQHVGILTCIC